jgi:hypothetical protein
VTGYSGTPLIAKLGMKPGARMTFIDAPDGFRKLLEPWPDAAKVLGPSAESLDLAVLFTTSAAHLERHFPRNAKRLVPSGALWVAWPKKASGVTTDLGEDRVRTIGLAAGLVDVKVCAIDETWSGLKFVVRTRDRA